MKIEYLEGAMLKKLFIIGSNKLEKNKEGVNALNVFPVPDGDTGTNMSLTMQSAIKQIKGLESEEVEKIASAAASGSLMGARGNSGVILSQVMRGFSRGLKDVERIDTKVLAHAFQLASDTAYKAVMKPIEGTVLTVARECAEKALEVCEHEQDITLFLEQVVAHGKVTLNKTPEMLDVLKQAGVVDAGGRGLLYILEGALQGLKGEEDLDEASIMGEKNTEPKVDEQHGNIEFGYCTEFMINKTKADAMEFREYISKFGDSILVVGADDLVKVHIHTNNPGEVLEEALKLGELIDIKIDNMRYQHRNKLVEQEEVTIEKETKKYSFISVAMGEGIESVFRDLRVDYVIAGGQTMNPSTEDILKAIENVSGEHVIILPNNSNIVLAATQAKELSERHIEVLPTKTIPQGIAALLAFEEDLDVEDNIENMTEAFKEVKTGQITYAVRDTVINDIEINKDDIIGICDGDIQAVGSDMEEVAMKLLNNIVEDENDLITVFYGEDIDEAQASQLAERIETELEDCDVEIVYGGQPLYYYLFSIE